MATQAVQVSKARPSLRERLDAGGGLTPYYLIFPTFILILLVAVYPLVDSIILSFQANPLSPTGNQFVGLKNYANVFSDPIFINSIGVTFIFSIVSVAFETLFGLGIALLINAEFRGRGLVRASILVPWAFPTIVSAQIWSLMYNDRTGIITYVLQGIHILGPGDTLLRTSSGIVIAAIIVDVWKTTPFMALLILAGLQVIPKELYEAASVDGSTRWQQFVNITLPQLTGPLVIALLFRILDAVRAFDLFYILAGNQVQSISSYAYNFMYTRSTFDFPTGVAAAVVLFVICVIISLVLLGIQRYVRR